MVAREVAGADRVGQIWARGLDLVLAGHHLPAPPRVSLCSPMGGGGGTAGHIRLDGMGLCALGLWSYCYRWPSAFFVFVAESVKVVAFAQRL
jgi:hypothetical protein